MLRNLLITISLVLSACASLPPPPSINTCIIAIHTDLNSSYAVCVPSQSSIRKWHVDAADATTEIPLSTMDNYISFSPDDWSQIESYLLKLKDRAQQSCNL